MYHCLYIKDNNTETSSLIFISNFNFLHFYSINPQSQKWSQPVLNKFVTNITWQVHHCKLNRVATEFFFHFIVSILYILYKLIHSFQKLSDEVPHKFVRLLSTCTIAYKLKIITQRQVV